MIKSQVIALRCAAAMKRIGRPSSRSLWAKRLGVSYIAMKRWDDTMLDYLCGCQSEEARRLLVGKSR